LEFNVPFQHKYGYIRDEALLGAVDSLKSESEVAKKPVVAQCAKTQAVMTLSQFEYDVAEICTLSNAVALVVAC